MAYKTIRDKDGTIKSYRPGVRQRAEAIIQDDPYRTSEGGFQDGRQAYYQSSFGKSVDKLEQSRKNLKGPLQVKTNFKKKKKNNLSFV